MKKLVPPVAVEVASESRSSVAQIPEPVVAGHGAFRPSPPGAVTRILGSDPYGSLRVAAFLVKTAQLARQAEEQVAIRSAKGLLDRMRAHPSACAIQIRQADDPGAAAKGLELARECISRIPHPEEPDDPAPNVVSPVNLTPAGPVIDFDMKDLPELMPRVLACIRAGLKEAGVRDAVIGWRQESDDAPLYRFPAAPRAVLLRLYPPPLLRYRWRSEVPRTWLDEARAWVVGARESHDRLWGSVESAQFPLAVEETGPFLAAQRRNRNAQHATLVTGDPGKRIRLCSGCFWAGPSVHYLTLAGGGPAADDDELLLIYERLRWIARRMAPSVAHAYIQIASDFGGWRGDPNSKVLPVCDELLFDAFPYQVLGAAHVERLGRPPDGARPLPGERYELSIGDPASWLPDDPRRASNVSAARDLLAPCLRPDREPHAISRDRHGERLLPPHPTRLLRLRDSPAGRRYFLAERPVIDGVVLELAVAGGRWIRVRYGNPDGAPLLRLDLRGPSEVTASAALSAALVVPYWAVFRWPGDEVDHLAAAERYPYHRSLSPEHPGEAYEPPGWHFDYVNPDEEPDLEVNLVLRRDAGAHRHWLAGKPLSPGARLELLAEGGLWLPVHYEWSGNPEIAPTFYLPLGGPWETAVGAPATAKLFLPPSAVLRWPLEP